MPPLIECVPNVSEGRDRGVIDALGAAISSVAGVTLLDVDPGADTNRTVFTFVGAPDAVGEAAVRLARRAHDLIDMSAHHGAHPRIGALDVCPFVPVTGATMADAVAVAHAVGDRIAAGIGVPVYFYEAAATTDARRSLASIRAGEYEGLEEKLRHADWQPDRGPARFVPRYGATVVGAREFLIAYNVNLNTRDRRLANDIALSIREAGRLKRDARGDVVVNAAGEQERVPGRLEAVRAIGWYIDQYRQAQVSINLLNFTTTPLHVVFETVVEEAAGRGLRVTGSELVGLIPLAPLVDAGRFYLARQGKSSGAPEGDLIDMAVRSLGLDQLGPFDAAKKVIEYRVRPDAPLAALDVASFIDEVSTDSPAPGGGSVAACAGALAAALTAMVANLTVGKRSHESSWPELSTLAERAQALKAGLVAAIDEDAAAFDAVIAAGRLAKATDTERSARAAAIDAANKRAAEVPLQTARRSLEALTLASRVAQIGQAQSATDAGVAALAAHAAVEGAILNVKVNLPGIADTEFVAAASAECAQLRARARDVTRQALDRVEAVMTSSG